LGGSRRSGREAVATATAVTPTASSAPPITAKDREFWAFRKPVTQPAPKVKQTARVRTPIDAFILARLEAKGLALSPDAPKLTLLRRAYFDLTGLPPTLEELQQYISDNRPDAYERLVDRLLASPQYGERWGPPLARPRRLYRRAGLRQTISAASCSMKASGATAIT